jgi:hypothetical protein
MMIPSRALLLVGSPKGPQSTTEMLGTYLAGRLQDRGLQVQKIRIHYALRTEKGMQSLFEAVDRTDILILAFPLYVDSLPAPVIRALELIAGRRKSIPGSVGAGMIAMVNCGFPEAFERMSKPLVPGWLYTLIGSLGWIHKAWRSGVLTKLNDRPYGP